MGLFARFVYSDGEWRDDEAADGLLVIDIHDSDIATIDFRSATTKGRFYLGFQPRDYWEDPKAGEVVDADAEVANFGAWAEEALGVRVTAADIRPLLAGDGAEEPADDFVEETVARLIRLLRLPRPPELDAQ